MFDKNLFAGKLCGITPYVVDRGTYKARLDANESFIQLPENLRLQFENAVSSFEFNRYPDPDATELVNAFCRFYGTKAESVCAGNGSDEIISLLMNCFLDHGDAVMTFSPDFSMYAFYAVLAGAKPVECPKDEKFQIDFDRAEKLIKDNKVKLVIFSNPCNPTGKIETKKNIAALSEKCRDTIFVVDEAYMDFASDAREESFLCDTEKYTNIIVLKTLSKALGAASLRLGFIICDKTFANMFKAVKSPYNVNGISQCFGRIVLENKRLLNDFTDRIAASTKSLLDAVVENGLGCPDKTYTNFVFFCDENAQSKWEYMRENGVLVRKFGISGGALRITSGNETENALVVQSLKNYR